MDLPLRFRPLRYFLILSIFTAGAISCGKKKSAGTATPPKVAAVLKSNQLAGLGGPIYFSQVASPIRWQRWSKETLENARLANRLVFVLVTLPQQPAFQEVLKYLERDPAIVKTLNESYVPVIVDADASREIGLLSLPLSAEIKQSMEMPILLWMTADADPVAWLTLPQRHQGEIPRLFTQSHQMVDRMWRDNSSYVLKNSKIDNQSRQERLKNAIEESGEPDEMSLKGVRQLTALFDAYSGNIDDTGGLLPSGVLDTVTAAAFLPDVPAEARARSLEMSVDVIRGLISSAMVDPLEGGIFTARVSQSWALPSFTWNCADQARIASLLFRMHQLTGEPEFLERGLGLIHFAENRFKNSDGLFSLGSLATGLAEHWLWKIEDIEEALPPEDAKWWIAATGMKSLGNLPSEVDPMRKYFRMNTLALPQSLEKTAAQWQVAPDVFSKRFEHSRRKLLEIRNARLAAKTEDSSPHAVSTFRMISAYAAAYTATGKPEFKEQAVTLLGLAKSAFYRGERLRTYGQEGDAAISEARAFVYGIATQASQDVADITSDDAFLAWTTELAGIARNLFETPDGLLEVSQSAKIFELPVVDRRRAFDDTSGGLFSLAASRISRLGHGENENLRAMSSALPVDAAAEAVSYTDLILSSLIQHRAKSVLRGANLSPELKAAVERLPLPLVPRGTAKDSDGVPEGSVRVIFPDGGGELISNPSDLNKMFLLNEKAP